MPIRRLKAMVRKEIQFIFRDKGSFALVILTPVLLLLIMAYALTVKIEHVPVAVLDFDQSASSQGFIQQITAGDDLDLYAYVNSMEAVEELLLQSKIKAAIIISPNFAQELLGLQSMPIQIIIDGTEPEGGAFTVDHILWRSEEYINQAVVNQFKTSQSQDFSLEPIDLRIQTWYNPDMQSKVSIIPGLISMVLGLPAMSVALSLAREWEHGTMEQVIVTPISRTEIMLGKIIPYILIALADVILLPIIAILWFDIPFNGSFLTFFFLSAIFLFAVLSMGLLIGVFIHTQAAAIALSLLLVFYPGFFMTGIFFPIVSMPEEMRMESLMLPGTHYAIITRGLFLPGVGLEVLWSYAVMLLFLGFIFTALSTVFFRKKLG